MEGVNADPWVVVPCDLKPPTGLMAQNLNLQIHRIMDTPIEKTYNRLRR